MALWLCLRFDALPLEALLHKRGPAPSVTHIVVAQRQVIACDEGASSAGVRVGQNLSTAQALLQGSETRIFERDPDQEAEVLQALCSWAYGLSPSLHCWRDNALMIEIGSCLALHRGLRPLIQHIKSEMDRRHFSICLGVAETQSAAWLLSHAEELKACQPQHDLTERLRHLPLTLLSEFFPGLPNRLEKTGLCQFGQLLDIPLAALGKRCGADFVDWLHCLLGRTAEPCINFQPPVRFQDTLWFGFDIARQQELHPAMQQLLGNFCRFLQHTQLSSGMIEWQLLRMRGAKQSLQVLSESALRQPDVWFELSRLRLEQVQLAEAIEGISLVVEQLHPGEQQHDDLFNQDAHRAPLHQLVDRLRSRLGLQAVSYLGYREEHLPEESVLTSASLPANRPHYDQTLAQRPFWLLPEPQPLHQEGQTVFWNGELEIVYGPERIEDRWWHHPVSRDYYIAHAASQQPVWLYQDRHDRRWYLHGLFA